MQPGPNRCPQGANADPLATFTLLSMTGREVLANKNEIPTPYQIESGATLTGDVSNRAAPGVPSPRRCPGGRPGPSTAGRLQIDRSAHHRHDAGHLMARHAKPRGVPRHAKPRTRRPLWLLPLCLTIAAIPVVVATGSDAANSGSVSLTNGQWATISCSDGSPLEINGMTGSTATAWCYDPFAPPYTTPPRRPPPTTTTSTTTTTAPPTTTTSTTSPPSTTTTMTTTPTSGWACTASVPTNDPSQGGVGVLGE